MKPSTIFAICLIAFVHICLQNVECKPFEQAPNNHLNLTILSGKFNPHKQAKWGVLVYVFNSDKALKLPIDSAEINKLDGNLQFVIPHLNFETEFVDSNGAQVVWEKQSFIIPFDKFSDQSYIALEVMGIVTEDNWNAFYRGGIELTIAQLMNMPHTTVLHVFDQEGDNGGITVSWK